VLFQNTDSNRDFLEGILASFVSFQAALFGQERHDAHQVLDADDADDGLKRKYIIIVLLSNSI
jgi:hypothetical protein